MSDIRAVQEQTPPGTRVRAAIARAAAATGVDFDFLLAQARIESSLDPDARAGTSSAAGLYQFTAGTWLQTLGRHGPEHGFDPGALKDPALRGQVMAMRYDPDAAALMAGELANDNRAMLSGVLGREPDSAELYLAHFLGAQGAAKLLTADPTAVASGQFPAAAASNRGVFYAPDGHARTVVEVLAVIRGKMDRAMGSAGSPVVAGTERTAPPAYSAAGPIGQAFHAVAADRQANQSPAGLSMAETLQNAFALDRNDTTRSFVRSAYGKLQEFGL